MEDSVAIELALMLRAGLAGGRSMTEVGAAKVEAGEAGMMGVVVVWCFWRKAGCWVLMGVGAGVDGWEEVALVSFSSWMCAGSGFLIVGTGPV